MKITLPKSHLYIMLNVKRIVILLLFISSITFQSTVFAAIKEDLAEEYRHQGFEEQQKGNLNGALSLYTKAVSLGLNNAVVYNDMGVLFEQVGLPAKAERHYLQSISLDKNYLPAYSNLGYFYLSRGMKEKAFKYLKVRFENAEPGDPWAEKAKEELINIHPGYEEAASQIEARRLSYEVEKKAQEELLQRMRVSQEHFRAADHLVAQEKYELAIGEYNKALELNPNNDDLHAAKNRAVINLSKQRIKERTNLAIELLNAGDTISARREVHKILTEIPNEPVLISR